MYFLVDVDGEEIRKVKGVNRGVATTIRYRTFVDVLFGVKLMRHRMKQIESNLYRIETYDVCKI